LRRRTTPFTRSSRPFPPPTASRRDSRTYGRDSSELLRSTALLLEKRKVLSKPRSHLPIARHGYELLCELALARCRVHSLDLKASARREPIDRGTQDRR